MHATIDSTLKIYDPGEYRAWIARQATYRVKGRIPAGQRRVVRFFRSTPEYISVPRGLLPRIKKRIPGLRVIDQRLTLPRREFGWRRKLRPYQVQAVRSLVQMGGGVLVSPAGSGKTSALLATAAALRQPTLWMVHTLDLAKQAMSEARRCYNLPPNAYGYIGERRAEIGTHFTVAMVQTLAKMPKAKLRTIARKFGTVACDEAHRSPAKSVATVLSEFTCKYRLATTATPSREDGLSPLMYHLLGPGSVTVPRAYLVKAGYLTAPQVRMVKTPFHYRPLEGDKQGWASLQRARAGSADRNRAICSLAAQEFRAGHRVVILVGLKSHARLLERALQQGYKLPAVAVTGEMDPYARERIKREVEAGKRILIATQLFDEGIDMPALDRLILAAPIKSKIKVEQQTGRTARIAQGKTGAIVYDFADTNVKSLHRHAKRRLALYQKLGYEVRVMDGGRGAQK